jgi:hypothetical protein
LDPSLLTPVLQTVLGKDNYSLSVRDFLWSIRGIPERDSQQSVELWWLWMYQVTVWLFPTFHTVSASGYVTGGTKTSLICRGADATTARRANTVRMKILQEVMTMLRIQDVWMSDEAEDVA